MNPPHYFESGLTFMFNMWILKNYYQLSSERIEILALLEHKRWITEKIQADWKFGRQRDEKKRIHPDIVPWDDLPETEKDKDYHAVPLNTRAFSRRRL